MLITVDLARRLEGLAARIDGRLALITGRSLVDIGGHLGQGSTLLVGSHGAEYGDATAAPVPLSRDAAAAVATLVGEWPGLLVETKPHGVAIHYRQEPDARSEEGRVGKEGESTCRT